MNKITITGRITADISLRTTQGGKSVTQFGLADTSRMNGKESVMYWNIVAWSGTAETISKYCKKGDQLIIYGHVRERDYTDKDGIYKTITEVMVEAFEFGAKKQNQTKPQTPDPVQEELKPVLSEEELPF